MPPTKTQIRFTEGNDKISGMVVDAMGLGYKIFITIAS